MTTQADLALVILAGEDPRALEQTLTTALEAGARLLAAASDKPWGDIVAYVEDPAGNVCALAEPAR